MSLPLAELEAQLRILARRVRRAATERGSAVHPDVGDLGYAVLEHLHRTGPGRQADVVVAVASEKAAVSRTVAQLVELGFVVRLPDPDDKRASRVELTPLGARRIAEVVAEHRARYAEKLAGLSAAELTELAGLLERYNAAMEA